VNILRIHGANLNLLGTRELNLDGILTLNEIDSRLEDIAKGRDIALRTTQSNSEGVLIDALQDARAWADGVIINPGAYGHYSYALAVSRQCSSFNSILLTSSMIITEDAGHSCVDHALGKR
jgi:3-dehydroquinate dehydratase-2